METDSSLIICTAAVATRLTREGIASGATGAATSSKGRSVITDKCKRRFNHQEQGEIRVNGWRMSDKKRQPAQLPKAVPKRYKPLDKNEPIKAVAPLRHLC